MACNLEPEGILFSTEFCEEDGRVIVLQFANPVFGCEPENDCGGTMWHNTPQNLQNGWETHFDFVFQNFTDEPFLFLPGPGGLPRGGFYFILSEQQATPSLANLNPFQALAINDFPGAIQAFATGMVFDRVDTDLNLPPRMRTITSIRNNDLTLTTPGLTFTPDNGVTTDAPFNVFEPGTHRFSIYYDTLISPPALQVYVDGILIMTQRGAIDQFTEISNSYIGFGSARLGAPDSRIDMYITGWEFTAFQNANIMISGSGGYQAFMNGVQFGQGLDNTRAENYAYQFQGGEVLSIVAPADAQSMSYLIAQLFLNEEREISTTGQWRCNNAPEPGWQMPGFDDSMWPAATMIGNNALSSDRHLPNIQESIERIWQANQSETAYCRFIVPRLCESDTATIPVASQCIFLEECNSITGTCFCPPIADGPNCDIVGNPSLSNIFPSTGTELGGTPVVVTGTNFSGSVDQCFFNENPVQTQVISFTTTICTSPPSATPTDIAQISVRRDGFTAASFPFQYHPLIEVTALTPVTGLARQNTTVTITGLGFVAPMFCRFFPDVVPAVVVSPTTLSCFTPIHDAAIVPMEVSINQVDFVSTDGLDFSFIENFSPVCRDFANPQTHPLERTFMNNVALGQTVMDNALNPLLRNASELVDGDFCCELDENNFGVLCGLQFNIDAPSSGSITLDLDRTALINQISISFFDPCRTTPPVYSLTHSGGTPLVTDRNTEGNGTPCPFFPSDSGSIALCTDFLSEGLDFGGVITSSLTWTFSNGMLDLDGPGGAIIYEVAAFGLFLDQPDRLGSLSAQFDEAGVTPFSVVSQISTPLPSFEIVMRNVQGDDGSVVLTEDIPITIALLNANNQDVSLLPTSRLQPPGNQFTQNLDQTLQTNGNLFDITSIANPVAGDYTLQFTSPGFSPLRFPLQITPGAFTLLSLMPSLIQVQSNTTVVVPPFQVCAQDAAGNPTVVSSNQAITSPSAGVSHSPATILAGSSCTTINDLSIATSAPGQVIVEFSAVGVAGTSVLLTVDIIEGPPTTLSFQVPPPQFISSGEPFEVNTLSTDIFLNPVGTNQPVNLIATITPVNASLPPLSISGTTSSFVNGFATLFLSFLGQIGGEYQISITIDANPSLMQTFVVQVQDCDPETNTGVSDDQYTCDCIGGFTFQQTSGVCVPCPVNTFKDFISNDDCIPCVGLTDTNFLQGQTSCVCQEGLLQVGFDCEECPEGGVCRGGLVTGVQQGYWHAPNSSNQIFYKCTRENPATRELEAADDACPGSNDMIDVPCGEGYTGTRCLVCDEDFGTSGPECASCPEDGINYFVVVLAALIIVGLTVFLIYQAQKPHNKKGVTLKILLSHLQMLGLLSSVGTSFTEPFQSILLIIGLSTFVDSSILVTDCALDFGFYSVYGFYVILPFILAVLAAVIHLAWFLIAFFFKSDKKRLAATVSAMFCVSVIVLNYVVYPGITIKILQIFDCSIEADGRSFLVADPAIECSGSTYLAWLVIGYAMTFLYCVGAPLFALFFVWKYRKSENEYAQLILRFLLDGYKEKKFYWEIMIVFRKMLLALAIIVSQNSGSLQQLYAYLWIIQFAILIHLLLRPYISGRIFKLEFWSLIVLLVTLGASVFLPTLSSSSPGAIFLSLFISFVNIFFVLVVVYFLVRAGIKSKWPEQWNNFTDKLDSIKPWEASEENLTSHRLDVAIGFLEAIKEAEPTDIQKIYQNIDKWWQRAPNYHRKRMIETVYHATRNTPFHKPKRKLTAVDLHDLWFGKDEK